MPTEQIQVESLRQYLDSIINAKLIALLNATGSDLDATEVERIISASDDIGWLTNSIDTVKSTGMDRTPGYLEDKLIIGEGLTSRILDHDTDGKLEISSTNGQNYVTNGNFRIWARSKNDTVSSSHGTSVNKYICDRVCTRMVNSDPTPVTLRIRQDITDNESGYNAIVIDPIANPSTGSSFLPFTHAIETSVCSHLNGRNVVVSFDITSSFTGNIAVSVLTFGSLTRSRVFDVSVVPGTQRVTRVMSIPEGSIDTVYTDTGMMIVIGAVTNNGTTIAPNDIWANGEWTSTTNTTNWMSSSGNNIKIQNLSLLEGSTPYDHVQRSAHMEELICARYYETSSIVHPPATPANPTNTISTTVSKSTSVAYGASNFTPYYNTIKMENNKRDVCTPVIYSPTTGDINRCSTTLGDVVCLSTPSMSHITVHNTGNNNQHTPNEFFSALFHYEADCELYDRLHLL